MPVLYRAPPTESLSGLHLFHYGASSCSQRVRIVLAEKELAYVGHVVDLLAREQWRPSYLAINPRGLVPVLVLDGERIVESIDILAYVELHYPTPALAGPDRAASMALRAAADGAQDDLRTITHEFVFRARATMARDDLDAYVQGTPDPASRSFLESFAEQDDDWSARLDTALSSMTRALDLLEQVAEAQPWLEGETFGLADIAWATTLHRLDAVDWPWARWPGVAKLYRRIATRPSFTVAVLNFEAAASRAAFRDYLRGRAAEGTSAAQRLSALA